MNSDTISYLSIICVSKGAGGSVLIVQDFSKECLTEK